MSEQIGRPCWYELMTSRGSLGAAEAFYGEILGWRVEDAGMEGFTYHLARSDGDLVAGMMEPPPDVEGMPPFWMIYFAVDDADKAAAEIEAAGGGVHRAPADIPDTGRFAVVADPQGAAFGILAPLPMTDGDAGRAFDQSKMGHGNWNELMTSDPEAGLAFYADLFGWTKGRGMDMGAMGTYQLIQRNGGDIGAIQPLQQAPVPNWLPYFGVNGSVTAVIAAIKEAGGSVHHGPSEVPGPAWIAIAQDPQGAWFALVGPEK